MFDIGRVNHGQLRLRRDADPVQIQLDILFLYAAAQVVAADAAGAVGVKGQRRVDGRHCFNIAFTTGEYSSKRMVEQSYVAVRLLAVMRNDPRQLFKLEIIHLLIRDIH